MDKLNIEDIKEHIMANRENTRLNLDNEHPSYLYKLKTNYWIISVIIKLDTILQDYTYLENFIDILKFSFNASTILDSFMSVDDQNNFIVQRLIHENDKNNIEDVIYQHKAYVEHVFDILHRNKLDSNEVASTGSRVLRP